MHRPYFRDYPVSPDNLLALVARCCFARYKCMYEMGHHIVHLAKFRHIANCSMMMSTQPVDKIG